MAEGGLALSGVVVLAALIGWKVLGESDHRRRLTAALVVFSGLMVLVVGR